MYDDDILDFCCVCRGPYGHITSIAHKLGVLGLSYGYLWTYYWGFDFGRADGIGGVSAGLTKREVRTAETAMKSAPARKRA
jgi:hypothetical protein